MSATTYMEASLELAKLAGGVALRSFQKALTIDIKSDGTPVTHADREAETAALEWLDKHFPEDAVLSEEFGLLRSAAPRRWVIDPIDGTKSFVRGVPMWGTLVAVIDAGQVVAGAAYFPALQESVAAAPGQGAWWNGARCRVSTIANLSDATLLATDADFPAHRERQLAWRYLTKDVALVRTWGDCYGYLLVATGRAEAMVDDFVSVWDVAALQPVIEEAGGVFTSWRGEPTPFGSDAIATNAALAVEIRERLGAAPPAAIRSPQ